MLSWHVVEVPIPLLWGKQSMKKAEVVLDLPNDRARVKGTWVDLVVSDCNHYGLNMLPESVNVVKEVDEKNENNDVSKEVCMLVESKELVDSDEDASGFDEEMGGDEANNDVANNNDDVGSIHDESDLRQEEVEEGEEEKIDETRMVQVAVKKMKAKERKEANKAKKA